MSANPFSVSRTDIRPCFIDRPVAQIKNTAEPIAFGLGDQIFGNPAIDIPDQPKQDDNDPSDAESDDSSSPEESLITAMASTSVADSFWAAAPSYSAVYLSTLSEYIPQPSKGKAPASARIEDPVEADGKAGKDSTWALETYENSVEIDNVFDRFTKRVEFTGEQCLRWVIHHHRGRYPDWTDNLCLAATNLKASPYLLHQIKFSNYYSLRLPKHLAPSRKLALRLSSLRSAPIARHQSHRVPVANRAGCLNAS